jgi:molecular chaperone GrpE
MSEDNEYATDADTLPSADDEATVVTDGAATAGDAVSRELAEQRDKHLRLAAEYDNYRRRTVKERQELHARGQADLIRGMIDTLDDLARVAHVDPAVSDTKTVVDGVSMVEKKLLKSLAGHGLEVVDPTDHPFDPATMEAVMTEPAKSPEEDHLVARVFQPGYLFAGQLLRPARVVVKQWNG